MTEEVTTIMAESMSEVQLVIYKKIVDGDLRKFAATSNDQPTGGGARDLRFSPAKEFMGAFKNYFLNLRKEYYEDILVGKHMPQLKFLFIHLQIQDQTKCVSQT